MSIASIGNSDNVPGCFEDYIVNILCQIVAGIIWANVIGCVCSTLSKGHPLEERLVELTDY